MKPERIVWHHSAAITSNNQFEKIDQWHKQRQFPRSSLGFYVGYHYVIEKDGTVRKAREETEIGAHDSGENLNSIGICFVGDFNRERPNSAQAAAGAALLSDIRSRHNIPLTRIEPHRWDDKTDCPGANVHDNWLLNEFLLRESTPALRLFHWIGNYYNLL